MSDLNEDDGFTELLADIEDKFGEVLRMKRAREVLEFAEVTGMVYIRAVGSGVPHDLAQAMAAEYWDAEMTQNKPAEAGEAPEEAE
ncbi:hypothetical protein ACIPYS_17990 [Kitasatospora sp. NPDC089913]|uniref:hypothetical protein n=1 Tax=Kitasatospora sp. NPDC089913 TaxID=3364080 RepID=UPI0037FD0302